ncbi:MAG: sulfotransferase family protein [Nitriliruptorales bacterium]
MALLPDQSVRELARRVRDTLAKPSPYEGPALDIGGLTPVFVGATGRSGTTLMMQLLGSSSQIAFDRIYAFEHGYLSYLWLWANLPEHGMKEGPDWRRAALDQQGWLEKHGKVGGIPWGERPSLESGIDLPFALDVIAAVWPIFSRRAAASHATEVGGVPTHYAETGPPWLIDELRRVFEALRAVYLIRDPRDQWLSMMSFFDKTGKRSFGYKPRYTPSDFAQHIADQQKETFALVGDVVEDATTLVVRYEQLVEDLDAEADRLSRWLGVDLDPEVVRDNAPTMAKHRTSTDGGSVGRWRREMDGEFLEIFHATMADELATLDYPLE